MRAPFLNKRTIMMRVFFIIGPFNFFGLVTVLSTVLSVATLIFPTISNTQPFIWLIICAVSFIGMFYICGAWEPTSDTFIAKNYAVMLCAFQVLMIFMLFYFLLPVVEPAKGVAYLCTVILIVLNLWSLVLTTLLARKDTPLLPTAD